MSLDWNLARINDYKNLCWINDHTDGDDAEGDGRRLNPTTEALIWMTMITGVGWGINKDNVEEFIARIDLWEKLNEPLLRNADGKPVPLSRDDALAHIGLETNVAMEGRADWLERIFANTYQQAGRWETFLASQIKSAKDWLIAIQRAAQGKEPDDYLDDVTYTGEAAGIELDIARMELSEGRWPTLVSADHGWTLRFNRMRDRWEAI